MAEYEKFLSYLQAVENSGSRLSHKVEDGKVIVSKRGNVTSHLWPDPTGTITGRFCGDSDEIILMDSEEALGNTMLADSSIRGANFWKLNPEKESTIWMN